MNWLLGLWNFFRRKIMHNDTQGPVNMPQPDEPQSGDTAAQLPQEDSVPPNPPSHSKSFRHRAMDASPRFHQMHRWLELLSFVAIISALPVAVFEYRLHNHELEQQAETEEVLKGTQIYQTIDNRYFEWIKLAVKYPNLDLYSVPADPPPQLTGTDLNRQTLLFSGLIDVMEAAYFAYHSQKWTGKLKKMFTDQWPGWEEYMRKFLARKSFLRVWDAIKNEYDASFQDYVECVRRTVPESR